MSKYLIVKSTMLPDHNIHELTLTSRNGKTLIVVTLRHDVRYFRGADCDTDRVREKLVVSKRKSQKFDTEGFNLKPLNEMKGKEQYDV
jgi:hypothetical protein